MILSHLRNSTFVCSVTLTHIKKFQFRFTTSLSFVQTCKFLLSYTFGNINILASFDMVSCVIVSGNAGPKPSDVGVNGTGEDLRKLRKNMNIPVYLGYFKPTTLEVSSDEIVNHYTIKKGQVFEVLSQLVSMGFKVVTCGEQLGFPMWTCIKENIIG